MKQDTVHTSLESKLEVTEAPIIGIEWEALLVAGAYLKESATDLHNLLHQATYALTDPVRVLSMDTLQMYLVLLILLSLLQRLTEKLELGVVVLLSQMEEAQAAIRLSVLPDHID